MSVIHSQGPWVAVVGETAHVLGSDGGRVAVCTHLSGPFGMDGRRSSSEVAANARLMAASPALLAEVRHYARNCRDCDGNGNMPRCNGEPSDCPSCRHTRAIIATATGADHAAQ